MFYLLLDVLSPCIISNIVEKGYLTNVDLLNMVKAGSNTVVDYIRSPYYMESKVKSNPKSGIFTILITSCYYIFHDLHDDDIEETPSTNIDDLSIHVFTVKNPNNSFIAGIDFFHKYILGDLYTVQYKWNNDDWIDFEHDEYYSVGSSPTNNTSSSSSSSLTHNVNYSSTNNDSSLGKMPYKFNINRIIDKEYDTLLVSYSDKEFLKGISFIRDKIDHPHYWISNVDDKYFEN